MATRRGNGEGSRPFLRKDGRWQVLVRSTDEDGVSSRHTVTGKTSAEARKKGEQLRARLKAGLPARDSNEKVGGFAENWVATTLAASDRKPSTIALYATLIRKHLVGSPLGAMPLAKVKKGNVDGWLASLKGKGLAPSTRRACYVVLTAVFNDAVANDLLPRNVVTLADRPKVPRQEAAHLSVAQVRSLLEASEGSRYRPLFELLARTGMRRGEGLALRWSDVDEARQRITVRGTLSRVDGELVVTSPKSGRQRTLRLAPSVAAVLKARRAEQRQERLRAGSKWVSTPYVFTTEFGSPVDPRNALRALKAAATKAGLEGVSVHTLRHSAAAAMIESGDHLKVISDQLGHAGIQITADVYGHLAPGLAEDAADRLGDAFG